MSTGSVMHHPGRPGPFPAPAVVIGRRSGLGQDCRARHAVQTVGARWPGCSRVSLRGGVQIPTALTARTGKSAGAASAASPALSAAHVSGIGRGWYAGRVLDHDPAAIAAVAAVAATAAIGAVATGAAILVVFTALAVATRAARAAGTSCAAEAAIAA